MRAAGSSHHAGPGSVEDGASQAGRPDGVPDGRVVVASSGSDSSRAAVARAAHEATVRGTALQIVHVVPPDFAAGPNGGWSDADPWDAARQSLDRDAERTRLTHPMLEVTTSLLMGSRSQAVVWASEGAALVVVGAAPRELVDRLWSEPVVMGIAARASCPVLIVPAEATPDPATGSDTRIVVGLKSRTGYDEMLRTAFALARLGQAGLRVVHAWQRPRPYDEAIAGRPATPAWEESELQAISGHLTDLRLTYPDVQAQIALVQGRPGPILVRESSRAGLLVISRPSHGAFVHHLGAAAREAIRGATCPVLMVPPDDVSAWRRRHPGTAVPIDASLVP